MTVQDVLIDFECDPRENTPGEGAMAQAILDLRAERDKAQEHSAIDNQQMQCALAAEADLEEENAQLRATNAQLISALEEVKDKTESLTPYTRQALNLIATEALSSDASQDLACIREAIKFMEYCDDWTPIKTALAALRERFGGVG